MQSMLPFDEAFENDRKLVSYRLTLLISEVSRWFAAKRFEDGLQPTDSDAQTRPEELEPIQ